MSTQLTCSQPSATTYLNLRPHFPVFSEAPDDIFFDNASTTQKPQCVIDEFDSFYKRDCSNAGRAVYPASFRAAQRIEQARQDVARFINANSHEVAFTAGATDSLNTAAWSWGLANLNDGDEILYCPDDHSSAVLPWQNLQAALAAFGKNIQLKPFSIHPVGDYDFSSIKRAMSDRTRLIAMSHIHHVYGVDMEVSDIRKIVGPEVLVSLDSSQSIGHTTVDVRTLDADFVSFSGHKMFAGNGVGVLFAKAEHHKQMLAFRSGGKHEPVSSSEMKNNRADFIDKVESGTANIPAIASLSAAIEFIESIGLDKIEAHVSQLTSELVRQLSPLPGIIFSPGPVTCGCPGGYGILSFRFEEAESMDIASALAYEKIYVRSGMHCRSSHNSAPSEDYIRVSMHAYNTVDDIHAFTNSLCNILS